MRWRGKEREPSVCRDGLRAAQVEKPAGDGKGTRLRLTVHPEDVPAAEAYVCADMVMYAPQGYPTTAPATLALERIRGLDPSQEQR